MNSEMAEAAAEIPAWVSCAIDEARSVVEACATQMGLSLWGRDGCAGSFLTGDGKVASPKEELGLASIIIASTAADFRWMSKPVDELPDSLKDLKKEELVFRSLFIAVRIAVQATASKTMAKRRHRENYELIDYAVKCWKESIDPSLSAESAANLLISQVPLSHKKLAQVVSSEKKKLSG